MWSTLDPGARVPLDTSLDFLLLKQTAQINWRGKAGRQVDLRWLNTVLQAVSGNARDALVLNKTNKHGGEKAMVHRKQFLKIYSLKFCDISQNFYFYRILNDENFKTEVEQTFFHTFNNYRTVILLII